MDMGRKPVITNEHPYDSEKEDQDYIRREFLEEFRHILVSRIRSVPSPTTARRGGILSIQSIDIIKSAVHVDTRGWMLKWNNMASRYTAWDIYRAIDGDIAKPTGCGVHKLPRP